MATSTNPEKGLLIGRPVLGKTSFEYAIVPKRDDIDVFLANPPAGILKQMYTINTCLLVKLLPTIYDVEFTWKVVPSNNGGVFYKGFIKKYKPIEINMENPLDSFKAVDDMAEYHEFAEPPRIDGSFILSLSRSTGAGNSLPKRLFSTPVITKIEDDGKTVVLNFVETYLYFQENPSMLKSILILPSYKIAVLFANPISIADIRNEILNRINHSIAQFQADYLRSMTGMESEEED